MVEQKRYTPERKLPAVVCDCFSVRIRGVLTLETAIFEAVIFMRCHNVELQCFGRRIEYGFKPQIGRIRQAHFAVPEPV